MMIGVVIVAGIMIGRQNSLAFQGDGYVLDITANEEEQSVAQVQFTENTVYRSKFPAQYKFRDIQGKTVVRDSDGFIHYADESLSAFADGMVVNMEEVSDGLVDFFRIAQAMVMTNDGSWSFSIDNNGRELAFGELLWLLKEETMMAAAPDMELVLAGSDAVPVSGYLEIRYLDEDIVQIASRDTVWQSVAYNSYIRFASGTVLNLYAKCVEDAQQNQLFTMEELAADMKSGGIALQSSSASKWEPPVFNVQTEDGVDGKDGTDGTDGTDGAAGGDGSDGSAGSDGTDGAEGTDGTDGSEGATGGMGNQGAPGAPGKGGSGAGTGGTPGGSGSSAATNTLGAIRISKMDFDCSRVDFTLTISNENNTLTSDSRVEIRETDTNKLIWYDDTVDLSSGLENISFSCSTLNPDTSYTILVSNGYEVETSSGVFNSGTKTFVQRDFFTASDGLSAQIGKVVQNTITLDVQNQPYSDVKFYTARIRVGGEWYNTGLFTAAENSPMLELTSLLAQNNISPSNQEFEIEIYTTSLESQSAAQAAFQEGKTDVYAGMTDGTVKKSKQILTGKTLKQVPTFDQTTVRRTDQGSFEIVANPKDDPDSSVRGYIFEIYDPSNILLTTLETTTNKTQWFYGALEPGTYTIKTTALWYDNEKNNEMKLADASVVATADGTAAFYFESHEINDKDQYVDRDGNLLDEEKANGIPATNQTRIWGNLVFVKNGVRLDTQNVTIEVASSDNSYHRILSVPINSTSNDVQKIPVKLIGLKANTAYVFTVTAQLTYTVVVGDAETESTSTQTLGRATVKTQDYAQSASGSSVFAFSVGPADTNSENDIVSVGWYNGKVAGFDTINTDPGYERIRQSARAIEFTVYDAGGAIAGKIVKDLYADPIFGRDPGSYGEAFEKSDIVQRAEIGAYYNGPLSNNWGNERILLTKSDFLTGGINLDNLRGKIRVAATALYDYSYCLELDFPEYSGYFIGNLSYNRIPLTTLIVDSAAGIYINEGIIDLDLQPPTLFDPAFEAVSVDMIRNGLNNEVGYRDEKLNADTVVGLKVQSNYKNYNGDTPSITYYGMTMDSFLAYNRPDGMDDTYDILKAYEDTNYPGDAGVLFGVTLNSTDITFTAGSVPPLYVVMTEDQALLKQCNKDDGTKTAIFTGGRAIYYTDKVKRGNCYVFAYTLKSLYGVDTTTSEDPWLFPYEINQHGGMYYGDVQRSAGTEILKQAPQARLYLDHTDHESEVWQYYVYDPDGALVKENNIPSIYASSSAEVKSQINIDQGVIDAPPAPKLGAEVGGHKYLSYSDADDRKIAATSFGLYKEWQQNSLSGFTLTIKDGGTAASLESYKVSNYEIWLKNKLFDGINTTKSLKNSPVKFINSKAGDSGILEEHLFNFALKTISHRYDYVEKSEINALKIGMKNLPESEILDITIPTDNPTLINHIAGFYYEIRDGEDPSAGSDPDAPPPTVKTWEERELLQYGTIPCVTRADGSLQISMAKLPSDTQIWIRLWAVYDTGKAGINLTKVKSNIPIPDGTAQTATGGGILNPPAVRTNYYAVQQVSDTRLYANSETAARQLSYSGTSAAASIYMINKNAENPPDPDKYMAQYLATRRPVHTYNNIQMNFVYGAEGAMTSDNVLPVFKALDHGLVQLTPSNSSMEEVGDGLSLKVKVPVTKPTVTSRSYGEVGLHSGKVTLTMSEKSIEQLVQKDPQIYQPRIYLELYRVPEGGGDPVLLENNASNDYPNFNWSRNQTNGVYSAVKVEGNEVYIDVTPGVLGYGIALRNLETGVNYRFRAYCKDEDGNRVDFIDNSISAGTLGEKLELTVVANRAVRVGDTLDVNTKALSAAYSQSGYESQKLEIQYSIRGNYSTGSFEDMYVEYKLTNANLGVTYDHDDIMGWIGYRKSDTPVSYEYYSNGGWHRNDYYPYITIVAQTEYQLSATMAQTIEFKDVMMNRLGAGAWQLEVRVIDKVTGLDVTYLDKEGTPLSSNDRPTTTFTIPLRTNPLFLIQAASQTETSTSMRLNLTVTVQDSSYCLGAYGPGGSNIQQGDCWLKIFEGDGLDPMDTAQISGWKDFYHNGESTVLSFISKPSTNYRIEVWGVRLEDNEAEDRRLYTFNYKTPAPMEVQLGSPMWEPYDVQLQTITLTTRNSLNLEFIETASVTLSIIHSDNSIKSQTKTMACEFVAAGTNVQKVTLSLTEMLENLAPDTGDLVDVTVAFYRRESAEPAAQSTMFFTFTPQAG